MTAFETLLLVKAAFTGLRWADYHALESRDGVTHLSGDTENA